MKGSNNMNIGDKVLVPDGYYDNGDFKPWLKAEILDIRGGMAQIKLTDSTKKIIVVMRCLKTIFN